MKCDRGDERRECRFCTANEVAFAEWCAAYLAVPAPKPDVVWAAFTRWEPQREGGSHGT